MPKTRQQKEATLIALSDQIQKSKSVVFANFQGLKVSESEELRAECREQGIGYVASKKTLLQRALTDAGIETNVDAFDGGIAVVFGGQDEVAPAQVIAKFAKTHEVVKIFGGVLEGAFINSAKVTALSKLLSKDELLTKMVGSLNAPVLGFVTVLAGNLRGLVTVLSAIKDAKE